MWVATASADGVAHLVPLSYAWVDERVVLAAESRSRTIRNLASSGRARLGFGPTRDVVIADVELDGIVATDEATDALAERYARQARWDPRREGPGYAFALLRLVTVQAWREANELEGRALMRDGTWLD